MYTRIQVSAARTQFDARTADANRRADASAAKINAHAWKQLNTTTETQGHGPNSLLRNRLAQRYALRGSLLRRLRATISQSCGDLQCSAYTGSSPSASSARLTPSRACMRSRCARTSTDINAWTDTGRRDPRRNTRTE